MEWQFSRHGSYMSWAIDAFEVLGEKLTFGLSSVSRASHARIHEGSALFCQGSAHEHAQGVGRWVRGWQASSILKTNSVYWIQKFGRDTFTQHLDSFSGGIYETQDFYDIADEFGILIWQDFMFACSMYQANPGNLANARQETKDQVRRKMANGNNI